MSCVRGLVATLFVLVVSTFTVVLGTALEGRADGGTCRSDDAHLGLSFTSLYGTDRIVRDEAD
jgi:hypothetical protein